MNISHRRNKSHVYIVGNINLDTNPEQYSALPSIISPPKREGKRKSNRTNLLELKNIFNSKENTQLKYPTRITQMPLKNQDPETNWDFTSNKHKAKSLDTLRKGLAFQTHNTPTYKKYGKFDKATRENGLESVSRDAKDIDALLHSHIKNSYVKHILQRKRKTSQKFNHKEQLNLISHKKEDKSIEKSPIRKSHKKLTGIEKLKKDWATIINKDVLVCHKLD